MRRGVWFGAGMAAGAYGVVRARRFLQTFTPDGIRDRLSGLGAGARVFGEEMRTGMAERETELRDRIGLMRDDHPRELTGPATKEREIT